MERLTEIKNKIINKRQVTTDEYLDLIQNDTHALWAFLISNNAGNINNTFRNKLGYTELTFEPNQKALARLIEQLLQKEEKTELTNVLDRFELNTKGLSPDFVTKFITFFSK